MAFYSSTKGITVVLSSFFLLHKQPNVLKLTFIGVSILILFDLSYRVLSSTESKFSTQHTSVLPTSNNADPGLAAMASLFGQYTMIPAENVQDTFDLEDYDLVGILSSVNESGSKVIMMSRESQEQRTYQVGDQLSEGIFISAITKDTVYIKHHGSVAKLRFAKNELTFEPPMKLSLGG